ncbi:SRPBCC family protein [Arthrobacter sp. M4]|uniref:SRPBCC family protein n=1 Tax=Arthrobacter sp. M4 TaxID=218160 RepID=UPI001CDBC0B6|nr:SRPBCC family protein [Arthrobacter sp. M4]MCA4132466.1 SRPBCC family protein [Arthrobacter sp. M4]
MPVTDESIVIPVPPEEVFDYLNDPTHLPEYDATVLTSELQGDGPVQVGSRFKGKSKILGRTFDWVVEVTEDERPTKQAIKSVEGKIDFTGTFTMTPETGGTRLEYRLESGAGLGGVFGRIADALVNKAYARQVRANLATLSEILTEHREG